MGHGRGRWICNDGHRPLPFAPAYAVRELAPAVRRHRDQRDSPKRRQAAALHIPEAHQLRPVPIWSAGACSRCPASSGPKRRQAAALHVPEAHQLRPVPIWSAGACSRFHSPQCCAPPAGTTVGVKEPVECREAQAEPHRARCRPHQPRGLHRCVAVLIGTLREDFQATQTHSRPITSGSSCFTRDMPISRLRPMSSMVIIPSARPAAQFATTAQHA
jgi:hypothetical protein